MQTTIFVMLAGLVVSLAVLWLILGAVVVVMRPDREALREVLRLPSDIVSFVRALLADPALPRSARVRLWLLLGYLLLPIDLVPDFIPVVGYADDAIVMAVLLRGVIEIAGAERVQECWNGSERGLAAVERLCGLA
jgi:uncharacterized membrane protein YkvA (DUF1232 family)